MRAQIERMRLSPASAHFLTPIVGPEALAGARRSFCNESRPKQRAPAQAAAA